MRLGLSFFREGDEQSRESVARYGKFILHPTVPRLWRRCSCGIRTAVKVAFEYEPVEEGGKLRKSRLYVGSVRVPYFVWRWAREQAWAQRARPDQDSHRRDCPAQGKYLGVIAKGWWHWFPNQWRASSKGFRHFEIEFAVGGEDNVAGLSLWLPYVVYGALGVHVPRKLTAFWIYNRREWGIKLEPYRPRIVIALGYDEQAKDMHDYYMKPPSYANPHCAVCKRSLQHHGDDGSGTFGGKQVGPHEFKPWRPTRLALWKGVLVKIPLPRVRNILFGKPVLHTMVLHEATVETIPMPEGNYHALIEIEEIRWRRPRAWWDSKRWLHFDMKPCSRDGETHWLNAKGHDVGYYIPQPHKDDDRDGCWGLSAGLARVNVADAVGKTVSHLLSDRARFRKNWREWVPPDGWPEWLAMKL